MSYKISVVVEFDENGFYAWCPELPGCQTQADTLDDVMKNIQEAAELYIETLPKKEWPSYLSTEILMFCLEVNV